MQAPTISSVSTSSGKVGDAVDISGTYLDSTTAIDFNGQAATSTFSGDYTNGTLHTTVPAGATTGLITITNPCDSITSSFTVIVTPSGVTFTPSGASLGATVTINGSGFSGVTGVAFNGHAASTFTFVNDGQVTAVVPAAATDGPISVTNPAGTGTSAATFHVLPTITSFTPTSGLPGTIVSITGSHFTGETGVTFGGTAAASVVFVSDTALTAVVASGSSSGPIGVTTANGTGFSSSNFNVVQTPSDITFSPGSGGVGDSVTITGHHFSGATAVKFNTATASFTVNSDTQITATVPPAATTGKVTVSTSTGSGLSASAFTVIPKPTVSTFLPTSGNVGAPVTINGSKFTGATAVKFNGVSATPFTIATDGKITTTVPTGATTGQISVTTPGGTGTSAASFTVFQGSVISSFTPASSADNGSVTVFGTGFSGTTSVKLNTTTATFTGLTDTQLTLKVPATLPAGSYTINVTNPVGTDRRRRSCPSGRSLLPTVTSIAPETGPANAQFQQAVVITGTGFTSVTGVSFGTKAATSVNIVSDTEIDVLAPVGATSGQISVTNPKGTVKSADPFVVQQPPTILGISPTSGRPTVTSVTITGANLTGSGALSVLFNGTPATSISLQTPTKIIATVPAGATTGHITVGDGGIGSSTSSVNFIVVGTPTITSFSPAAGKATTVVTIDGSGFLGGSTPVVTFNGVHSTLVHVSSDSVLTATAPVSTTGPIVVTNDAGSSAPSATNFIYQPAPVVSNFTPTHGPANASMTTLVDITGSNFTGATVVAFGTKAASFTFVSDTELMAFAPSGATSGKISVTTPSGTSSSANMFVVDAPPVVTGFTPAPPAGGIVGSTVQVKGTNFRSGDHVLFNGTPSTLVTFISSTQINATVPAGATTGKITVAGRQHR